MEVGTHHLALFVVLTSRRPQRCCHFAMKRTRSEFRTAPRHRRVGNQPSSFALLSHVSAMKRMSRYISLYNMPYLRAEIVLTYLDSAEDPELGLSPRPHLQRLLAIIVLSTTRTISCFSCLRPAKLNLQQINRLRTASFIDDVPCVYYLVATVSIHNRQVLPIFSSWRRDIRR